MSNKKLKKVVLFIVEGPSDKQALEKIFQKIYADQDIVFKFTSGDLTSDKHSDVSNIEKRIYDIVLRLMNENKFRKSDILRIVQIVDTDGVFIPDEAIVEGESYHFFYTLENISCQEPGRVITRNAKKRTLLNHLMNVTEIRHIPYSVFFMSCNLDHALYNEQNLDKAKKIELADAFYKMFRGHEELFQSFLQERVSNGVPEDEPGGTRRAG